ncbi:hypothetical protein K0651_04240 [Ornithinimicrobium sp. Arc0846-15]|nr:hypothetical protein [Ornithinimicrobium laminariae]
MSSIQQPTRRTIAHGLAWSVPVVTIAGTAPAIAASTRKDPGINGWVLNTRTSLGSCQHSLRVNSSPTTTITTPDSAPFGLYVYDVHPENTFSNIRLVYWIIGNQTATWAPGTNHSSCWSSPVRGTPTMQPDSLLYTPYTFTYTCPLLASQISPPDSDGVARLKLGRFDTTATFTQPTSLCNDVTYWTQRFITIDEDGSGPAAPEVRTFQRRNGTRGTYTAGALRSAARQGANSDSQSDLS